MSTGVKWEEMHQKGNRPWDLKGITPILKYFIEEDEIGKKLAVNDQIKSILIPGCGQKNDSEFLGKMCPNAQIVGADISPTAVRACQEELDPSCKNVKFIEADFFETEMGKFDLIFDHTFFCAIHPEMRRSWGNQMAALVNCDGYLLTLMYPLPLDPRNVNLADGPPFDVTFSAYEDVLSNNFDCIQQWDNQNLPISNEKRKGREALSLWKPLSMLKLAFPRSKRHPQFMGQVISMFSSFSGERWDFEKVLSHSQKSPEDLSASHEYLIDVREVSEIQSSGAIPNAINIPLGSVDSVLRSPKAFKQIVGDSRAFPDTQDDKLIFTCQSGMRAGRAAGTAKGLGFEKVAVYPGSFSDWRNQITNMKK